MNNATSARMTMTVNASIPILYLDPNIVREAYQFKARVGVPPPLHARWATARRPTRNAREPRRVRTSQINQGEEDMADQDLLTPGTGFPR